jgi:hypothetical protein
MSLLKSYELNVAYII